MLTCQLDAVERLVGQAARGCNGRRERAEDKDKGQGQTERGRPGRSTASWQDECRAGNEGEALPRLGRRIRFGCPQPGCFLQEDDLAGAHGRVARLHLWPAAYERRCPQQGRKLGGCIGMDSQALFWRLPPAHVVYAVV